MVNSVFIKSRPPLTRLALIKNDLTNTFKHHNIKAPLSKDLELSETAKYKI